MPEIFDSRLNVRGPATGSKWVQVATLSPQDTAQIKAAFGDGSILATGWIDPAADELELELVLGADATSGFPLRVYDGPSGSGYLTLDRSTITVGRNSDTRKLHDADDFWASKLVIERRRDNGLFLVSTPDTRIRDNIKKGQRLSALPVVPQPQPIPSSPSLTKQDERDIAFGMAIGAMLAPHVRVALAQRLAALSPPA